MLKEINDYDSIDICDYKFSHNDFEKVYGYYIENNLVGIIDFSIIYDRIEINYIFVKKEYRKQGIASKMMEYIISYNLGISLEVNEENESAIKLYEKYGFKKEAIRKNYYGKNNGILMIRW